MPRPLSKVFSSFSDTAVVSFAESIDTLPKEKKIVSIKIVGKKKMKLGKHFLIFVSLLLILGTLVSMVIYKFIPLLVHHTIYYCQAIAHTLSFQMPENLGMIIFIIIYAVIFTQLLNLFLHF